MLTKEECEKALDRVARFCSWFSPYKCPECIKFKNELDILDKLIEEHFSNPPLKFEEIRPDDWVWDNKDKYYFKCNQRISTDMAECVWYESFWYNTGEEYDEFYEDYIEFEENRFYRKEVQE